MNITSKKIPLDSLEISDAEFVVCDVETTGLHPFKNRLTEIALVKVRDGEIIDRFHTLINPQQFIPQEITEFTGITNEMVYTAPKAREVMPSVREFIGDCIFVGHNVKFDRGFVDATLGRLGLQPIDSPNLCTCRLARRLYPKLKSKSLGNIASHIGVRIKHRHRALGDAEATVHILQHFIEIFQNDFEITNVVDLLSFQNKPVYRVTSPPRNVSHLKEVIGALPCSPGVYLFHDKHGNVLYVGKAKNLKDRVSSYFYHNVGHTRKVVDLVKHVHHLSYEETETELSALLLELQLIKRHQPRFNSQMKHDRRFPFIRLDVSDDFPTISWCYEIEEEGAEYFGPFSSRFAVESALETINRLFLIRECDGNIKPKQNYSPCIYYDMKQCGAPCAMVQSKEEYDEEVIRVKQFLQGMHDEVLDGLQIKMETYSSELRFEDAAAIRDRLTLLKRIIRQQETMVLPIRSQNLIIVTPARRTNVEVHCIKNGMLSKKYFIDQKSIDRRMLSREVKLIYFNKQTELFNELNQDVHEMRIIASWCLAHRDESKFIFVEETDNVRSIGSRLFQAIVECGEQRKSGIVQTLRYG